MPFPPASVLTAGDDPMRGHNTAIEQAKYFKDKRVGALLNNMVRQLLIELPEQQADVLDCLIRYLTLLEVELTRATKLGHLKRNALATLPKKRKLYTPAASSASSPPVSPTTSGPAAVGGGSSSPRPAQAAAAAPRPENSTDDASATQQSSPPPPKQKRPLDRDGAAAKIQALARGRAVRSAASSGAAPRSLAALECDEAAGRQEIEYEEETVRTAGWV